MMKAAARQLWEKCVPEGYQQLHLRSKEWHWSWETLIPNISLWVTPLGKHSQDTPNPRGRYVKVLDMLKPLRSQKNPQNPTKPRENRQKVLKMQAAVWDLLREQFKYLKVS